MGVMRTRTLGIRVDAASSDAFAPHRLDALCSARAAQLFTFVNPGSVALAARDSRYRDALDAFDVVLPDGVGMCWAIRIAHGIRAMRVSFDTTSLAPAVFAVACRNGWRIAFVGGRPGVAEAASRRVAGAHPGLKLATAMDGYGDFAPKIRAIADSSAQVVICGMGCGRQESFLLELRQEGWTGIGFTCGGYLDQLCEDYRYYPDWIDAANLRWAYRLVREPRRLGRRYGVDYGYFLVKLAPQLVTAPARGLRHRLQPRTESVPPMAIEQTSER